MSKMFAMNWLILSSQLRGICIDHGVDATIHGVDAENHAVKYKNHGVDYRLHTAVSV